MFYEMFLILQFTVNDGSQASKYSFSHYADIISIFLNISILQAIDQIEW
jgi:hypothetical protein